LTNYEPKIGDRVRVVLEADVVDLDLPGFGLGTPTGPVWFGPTRREAVVASIEKIEPPVTVFKRGAVLAGNYQDGPGRPEFMLTDRGYVDLINGIAYDEKPEWIARAFTSRRYHEVSLG
jgi:hypothetical protein